MGLNEPPWAPKGPHDSKKDPDPGANKLEFKTVGGLNTPRGAVRPRGGESVGFVSKTWNSELGIRNSNS